MLSSCLRTEEKGSEPVQLFLRICKNRCCWNMRKSLRNVEKKEQHKKCLHEKLRHITVIFLLWSRQEGLLSQVTQCLILWIFPYLSKNRIFIPTSNTPLKGKCPQILKLFFSCGFLLNIDLHEKLKSLFKMKFCAVYCLDV